MTKNSFALSLKTVFLHKRWFLGGCLLFFLISVIVLSLWEKGTTTTFLNQHHHPFTDVIFSMATYLGDGIVIIGVCLLLLFINKKYAIYSALIFGLNALVVQILKRLVFDMDRPAKFLQGDYYTVPGTDVHHYHSLPSGHTNSAFVIFFMLCYLFPGRLWQIFCFTMALMAAISRMYLYLHFMEDVFFGALIGVISTYLWLSWMDTKNILPRESGFLAK